MKTLKKIALLLFRVIGRYVPTDAFARRYPVSVKGVLIQEGKVVLLKNERDEWELPGGKLGPHETVEECLRREIEEELNIQVQVGTLSDVWVYNVLGKVKVLIVTYQCFPLAEFSTVRPSHEHKALGIFELGEVPSLHMPQGYKNSIDKVARLA